MIDTHCHIDDPQYQPLEDYLHQQQDGGVETIIVPATDAASSQTIVTLCPTLNFKLSTLNLRTYPAVGLHPEEVGPDWKQQLDEIEPLLTPTPLPLYSSIPIIAIGEIGLDYHFSTEFKQEQQMALRRQLRWAKTNDLPVIIHMRDATEDCLRILEEEHIHNGVLHCFSGSHEIALRAIQMGFYLGIGGVITFKNCKLKETLVGIPLERLVLETDGPYMAPVPHRGERNESRWIIYVMEALAQVYQVDLEKIDRVTTANAKTLFRIK